MPSPRELRAATEDGCAAFAFLALPLFFFLDGIVSVATRVDLMAEPLPRGPPFPLLPRPPLILPLNVIV
jgi:hypothetical protein